MRFSTNEVYYSQAVVRYIENVLEVPVGVENASTQTKFVIWPKSVSIKYRVPFTNAKQYTENDFEIVVDYTHAQNNSIVRPNVVKIPKEVIYYSIEPKFVECLF